MATCGEYELEKAIGWGRRATFFAARVSGAKGPAAIVIRRARTVEGGLRHAFLRSAAEQQAAVGAGCRRLAPILTFACDETGFAYSATARYETSLAEFIEAGCKVDGALLREIVTAVLSALAELHEKSRRAHGNLTPGNILLDPQGRIFLTDLAPSAKDATTADDLFALGALIYQLVRRTSRIGMLNPPLDYSPEWTDSLGDDAEGWREFTNRVLTKSRNKGPEALKTAAADLKSLASLANLAAKAAVTATQTAGEGSQPAVRRAPPKKRSPLPKIAALLLFLGAISGGGYFYWQKLHPPPPPPPPPTTTHLAYAIGQLRDDLKKPLPPNFAAKLDAEKNKNLKSALGRIRKILDGAATANDIKAPLGNWEAPDQMKQQAAAWRNMPREWTRLANELESSAEITLDGEEGDKSILAQIENAIDARDNSLDLERVWYDTTLILKDLKDAKNPQMPDFTPWATNEILNAKNLADAPVRGTSAMEKLREVLTFQREMRARVLWERLAKESPEVLKLPGSEMMQGWPARWKKEALRFVAPTPDKIAEWNKIFTDAEKRIPRLRPADQAKWRTTLKDERAAAEGTLESDVAAIDKRLLVFNGMITPAEEDYNKYSDFLDRWREGWRKFKPEERTKDAAKKMIADFTKNTSGPTNARLAATYGTAAFLKQMNDAVNTPDRITAEVPGWTDATPPGYDPNALILQFTKGKESVAMPFLALDANYAMAAFETPLILARLSGAPAGAVHDGPQIRREGYLPSSEWLWKNPLDLQASSFGIRYFAPGVAAGDTTAGDYCPATWIAFSDADSIAKKLGGLLPTADQWKLALPRAGKERRLRSAAWSRQFPLLETWKQQTQQSQNSSSPDSGSFSKTRDLLGNGNNGYLTDSSPAPGATNDGKLWLTITPDQKWKPASGFLNLIGNAAEWVSDNGTPAVIGGSVVSPPSLPTDRPLAVTERGGTYFDVTFRLLIKLGPGGATAWLTNFEAAVAAIPTPQKPAGP